MAGCIFVLLIPPLSPYVLFNIKMFWSTKSSHNFVQCPAIDYIIHTLDGATILLNNSKYFPSRLVFYFHFLFFSWHFNFRISVPEPSLKHFQSIARRLYRIFAHAYFHHREVYEYFEVKLIQYAFLIWDWSFVYDPEWNELICKISLIGSDIQFSPSQSS